MNITVVVTTAASQNEPVCTCIRRKGRQAVDKGHKDHENDDEAQGQGRFCVQEGYPPKTCQCQQTHAARCSWRCRNRCEPTGLRTRRGRRRAEQERKTAGKARRTRRSRQAQVSEGLSTSAGRQQGLPGWGRSPISWKYRRNRRQRQRVPAGGRTRVCRPRTWRSCR